MAKLRMCANCRAFVPDTERNCTECQAPMGPSYAKRVATGAALFGLVPHTHFTTLIILLINGGLFAATLLMSMKQSGGESLSLNNYILYYFGAKESGSVLAGQWWRLVTAGFLHGGFLHILMNSWVLYDLGAQVEQTYGTARLLVFYVAASVMGFVASTFWTRALSLGASAALFGLIGSMIALGYRYRHTAAGTMVKAVYTRWVIYGLLFSLMPGIDMAAHVGGLVAGFALGYVAGVPRQGSPAERLWQGLAVVAVLLVVVSFGMVWLAFPATTRSG
jgi:rhomboid protease GluP